VIEGHAIYQDGKHLMFLGYGTRHGAETLAQDLHKAASKQTFTVKKVKISVSEME